MKKRDGFTIVLALPFKFVLSHIRSVVKNVLDSGKNPPGWPDAERSHESNGEIRDSSGNGEFGSPYSERDARDFSEDSRAYQRLDRFWLNASLYAGYFPGLFPSGFYTKFWE